MKLKRDHLTRQRLAIATGITLIICFTSTIRAAAKDEPSGTVNFAREVLPILSNKCFVCHGPDTRKKDLVRLDSYEGATKKLDDYHAIDPKKPNDSELLVRIHDTDDPMPPVKSGKKLTAGERDILTRWVKQGGKYAKHWAFVKPVKAKPSPAAGLGVIDSFIAANHKTAGTTFAPEADKTTLARRVALILTGLPPDPQLLAAFLNDKGANAYDTYIDKLFADPHYGEHQARYWLDAVRYGDTHGLHLDNKRGIYPYRDWVIQAFNKNQPFDEFITWQLAGDLLPSPTLAQRVATGFVRMNPSTAEGGAIPAEFQAKNNFDRTESFGTVLLGMTMICSRCHTHKYDPITQTEYYKLLAFFNSTAEGPMDGNKYIYGPIVKAPANIDSWKQWEQFQASRDKLIQTANKTAKKAVNNWTTLKKQDQFRMLADAKGPFSKSPLHVKAIELGKQMAAAEKSYTTTLVAQDLGKPRVTKLLERGEYNLPTGEALLPDTLAVMSPFPKDAPRNRLGLAQWLTSRENPVVARVLINRVWQRVFGDGLVRTPEDFGLQGQQPTHPELLDWLAVEMQDSGWDLQHMQRLMVKSKAFKQSSARRKSVSDPENRLFARGPNHRLDGEVIRDIGLWASGLLDPQMGGEGIKPWQPPGMWRELMHPGSNTKSYVPDKGTKPYRRSLYVYWKRTSPHPMMMLFDAPNRETSCVRRSRTNTSLQSLGLLNEIQRVEMARSLAQLLIVKEKSDAKRLDQLYTLLASRNPSALERATCMKLLTDMKASYAKSKDDAEALLSSGLAARDKTLKPAEHAAWTQVIAIVLSSDAVITLY
jgi:hypothetical protein